VAPEVASERLQRLLEAQKQIQSELNRELVGREMEVLVTGWGKDGGRQVGRTSCNRIVHFEGASDAGGDRPGTIVPVRINRAMPHSLLGERSAVEERLAGRSGETRSRTEPGATAPGRPASSVLPVVS
jgi:tRNA-2-methylthio-N6-dimethylallyladenosine synthase